MKQKDRVTTSQLLTQIRQSGTFLEVLTSVEESEEPSFCQQLYEIMKSKGIQPRELIAGTGIDRSYFYHILSGRRIPSRNVTIRITMTMRCTLTETNRLLRLAGLSNLYPRIRREAVLIYAIEHKATPQEANDLLIEAGEEPLYR